MAAASSGAGAEEEGATEEAEDPGIVETTEVGIKEIQVLTDFGADSNGYYSVSSPQWTPYSHGVVTSMATQLAESGQSDVLCRLVEYGSYDVDLVAYDGYFLINVSDLADYQEAMERAAALSEEIEEGTEYAAYMQAAKDEYQNMAKYVLDSADDWIFNEIDKDAQAEIQENVWNKVFASDGFLDLIQSALVSADEISASSDGSYKNAISYMYDNKVLPEDDASALYHGAGVGAFYYINAGSESDTAATGKTLKFGGSSTKSGYESAGYYVLMASDYSDSGNQPDGGDYGDICILGNILLDFFDRSGVRWSSDREDSIKIHFESCDL